MIKVALKGLAGRKVRALLTALAVVIGVSMVSGTFVLTDTMQKAFDGIFEESYEGTDAVINGKQLVEFSSGGRATVPADLVKQVQELPSVDAAAGSLMDLQSNSNPAKVLDNDGEVVGRQGETMGIGIDDAGRQFSPLKLKQGEWADSDSEIVLDAGTAVQAGLQGRRQGARRRQRRPQGLHADRRGHVRLGRLARWHHARDLRRPDRPGAVRQEGPVRLDLGQGEGRRDAGSR